jgi:hypothetical protein
LLDAPFDYTHHRMYETSQIVEPGDRLTTRCSYFNDAPYMMIYQPSSSFEVCYHFVYAHPARALYGVSGVVGAENMCMH